MTGPLAHRPARRRRLALAIGCALALGVLAPAAGPRSDSGSPGRAYAALRASDDELIAASGSRALRVGLLQQSGRATVVSMPLEVYVARVLAGEGEPRAGDAARRALAITARTYALANLARHRRDGYDLCDSTHCQVLRPATDATRQAALATAGRLLMFDAAPASVFYSASCGGRSELASEVWPGAIDYPYEPSIEDDACAGEPRWELTLTLAAVERALRQSGFEGRRLRDVAVMRRNRSGRVTRLRLAGLAPSEISGNDFRLALVRSLGPATLRSTAFRLRRTRSGLHFTGQGYGHGVGLCVIGAGRRSQRGESAEAILRFYFPGLQVASLDDLPEWSARLGAAPAEPAAAAPAPAAPAGPPFPGGIGIVLPTPDESTRRLLADIVRLARDEAVDALGTRAPPEIRLLVYESVEAFRRETGRPWWSNGLTTGAVIELPPVSILRQRGVLERTVREEVGRVLLDPALQARPLWVRVGLARRLARGSGTARLASAATPRTRTVRCPSEAELLMAVSAAAQREAEARAEACVAREIGRGRSWREIG